MPSEIERAFSETLRSAASAKGSSEVAIFRAREIHPIFGIDDIDIQPVAGGDGDSSPIMLSISYEECGALPIDTPNEEIYVRDRNLYVLSYRALEGRVDLICGDPAATVN